MATRQSNTRWGYRGDNHLGVTIITPDPEGVYVVQCGNENYAKVGYSKHVCKRIRNIQQFCPFPLPLRFLWEGATLDDEGHLHNVLKSWKVQGEWFLWNYGAAIFLALAIANIRARKSQDRQKFLRIMNMSPFNRKIVCEGILRSLRGDVIPASLTSQRDLFDGI
jgi:hypothetical protein